MATHKYIDKLCVIITLLSVLITVLFMNGERFGLQIAVDQDSEAYSDSEYFTEQDQNGGWDTSSAVQITLDGTDAAISGSGAYTYDGNVVIGQTGRYVISGTLTDGSIIVDAQDASKIYILLDGVEVYCSDNAAFRVDQADKVFLTLAEGKANHFSGGKTYSDEALDDGTKGTVFAHDDLTINGSGSLTIESEYKHGIAANDDLVIVDADITVDAAADAVSVNDSIRTKNATMQLEAEDDGIAVTHEDGYFYIESGKMDIKSGGDAIHAAGDVTVAGGEISISAADDGIHSDTAIAVSDGAIKIEKCYEGLEALTIDVSGGEIAVYPEDDGFNANGGSGDMMMQGPPPDMQQGGGFGQTANTDGNVSSQTANTDRDASTQTAKTDGNASSQTANTDGDASTQTAKTDGNASTQTAKTDGNTSSQTANTDGNTAAQTANSDGNASTQTAKTDGNAALQTADTAQYQEHSGNRMQNQNPDQSRLQNRDQMQNQNRTQNQSQSQNKDQEEEETYIHISGGRITIINETGMDADGLDSNGDIEITGGTIFVSLQGGGSNNAVDFASENGGKATISGGTLIACGGAGMVEAFDSSSKQCVILYNLTETTEAGSLLQLKGANGKTLLSDEIPCGFSSANISCPDIEVGQTYTLTMGSTTEEVTIEETSSTYGATQTQRMGGGRGGPMMMQQRNAGDGTTSQSGDGEAIAMQPPQWQQGQQNPQAAKEESEAAEDTEETEDTGVDIREIGKEEWILLGTSAMILLFGFVFVIGFRRRGR